MEIDFLHFETLPSTQSFAKSQYLEFSPHHLTCITADVQTQSYGRNSRPWVSKKGNLHMTLFFHLPKDCPFLANLAQVLALSCAKTIETKGISVQIKWPNDLIYEDKKLCGTLAEVLDLPTSFGIVLGIGVNVNAPIKTSQPTIALTQISHTEWDLRLFSFELLSHFEVYLTQLLLHGFAYFKDLFESHLAYKGKKVMCQVGKETKTGVLKGLSLEGALLLKTENEEIVPIYSGELSKLSSA